MQVKEFMQLFTPDYEEQYRRLKKYNPSSSEDELDQQMLFHYFKDAVKTLVRIVSTTQREICANEYVDNTKEIETGMYDRILYCKQVVFDGIVSEQREKRKLDQEKNLADEFIRLFLPDYEKLRRDVEAESSSQTTSADIDNDMIAIYFNDALQMFTDAVCAKQCKSGGNQSVDSDELLYERRKGES
jgi:hypothetical protein